MAFLAPTALNHSDYLTRRSFESLDGLRALGILGVVAHHTLHSPGRIGSNIFLLLSGFLVTALFLREEARTGGIDLSAFRLRRTRRLYPLYFAVLAAYVAAVFAFEAPGQARAEFFANLPYFATFTSNLCVKSGEHVIFFFCWTLAAQEQFHFAWSWFLKQSRTAARVFALAALLIAVYVGRTGLFGPTEFGVSTPVTLLLSIMPTILWGALLAVLLHTSRGYQAIAAGCGSRSVSLAAFVAVVVIWRCEWIPTPFMHLAMLALTAACVVREDHLLAPILRWAPLAFVGRVSYGVYLTHMLCFHVASRALDRFGVQTAELRFLATVALTIAVAALSHFYFESLFLAKKDSSPAAGEGFIGRAWRRFALDASRFARTETFREVSVSP